MHANERASNIIEKSTRIRNNPFPQIRSIENRQIPAHVKKPTQSSTAPTAPSLACLSASITRSHQAQTYEIERSPGRTTKETLPPNPITLPTTRIPRAERAHRRADETPFRACARPVNSPTCASTRPSPPPLFITRTTSPSHSRVMSLLREVA